MPKLFWETSTTYLDRFFQTHLFAKTQYWRFFVHKVQTHWRCLLHQCGPCSKQQSTVCELWNKVNYSLQFCNRLETDLEQLVGGFNFQPTWKIWVKMGSSSPNRDEHKKIFELPPPRQFLFEEIEEISNVAFVYVIAPCHFMLTRWHWTQ